MILKTGFLEDRLYIMQYLFHIMVAYTLKYKTMHK